MQYVSIMLIGVVMLGMVIMLYISRRRPLDISILTEVQEFNDYDILNLPDDKKEYIIKYKKYNTKLLYIISIVFIAICITPFVLTIVDTLHLADVIDHNRYNIRMRDSLILLAVMWVFGAWMIKLTYTMLYRLSRKYRTIIKNMSVQDFDNMNNLNQWASLFEKYNHPYLISNNTIYLINAWRTHVIDLENIQLISVNYGYKWSYIVKFNLVSWKSYTFAISSKFAWYLEGLQHKIS